MFYSCAPCGWAGWGGAGAGAASEALPAACPCPAASLLLPPLTPPAPPPPPPPQFARLIGTREHAEFMWRITKDEQQHSTITQVRALVQGALAGVRSRLAPVRVWWVGRVPGGAAAGVAAGAAAGGRGQLAGEVWDACGAAVQMTGSSPLGPALPLVQEDILE